MAEYSLDLTANEVNERLNGISVEEFNNINSEIVNMKNELNVNEVTISVDSPHSGNIYIYKVGRICIMNFDINFVDTTSNITFTVPKGFIPDRSVFLPCIQYDSDGYSAGYLRIYASTGLGTALRDTGHSSYTWISTQAVYICE